MIKYKVKKIHKDCVEIHDYIVNKAVKRNEPIEVEYNGRFMILSVEDLTSKRTWITERYASRTGGQDYRNYGYLWEPETKTV